jgi:hypothetical protein
MSTQGGGLGIVGVLTIVFVVLKLTNNIDWAWIWVLSPLWIGLSLAVVGSLFAIAIFLFVSKKLE